jgi:hypothetical protein
MSPRNLRLTVFLTNTQFPWIQSLSELKRILITFHLFRMYTMPDPGGQRSPPAAQRPGR